MPDQDPRRRNPPAPIPPQRPPNLDEQFPPGMPPGPTGLPPQVDGPPAAFPTGGQEFDFPNSELPPAFPSDLSPGDQSFPPAPVWTGSHTQSTPPAAKKKAPPVPGPTTLPAPGKGPRQQPLTKPPAATAPANPWQPPTVSPKVSPAIQPTTPIVTTTNDSKEIVPSPARDASDLSRKRKGQEGTREQAHPSAVRVVGDLADDGKGDVIEDLSKTASEHAPPWLISMVVHVILVLALALIPLTKAVKPTLSIQANYSDEIGEQMLDDSIVTSALETVTDEALAFSRDVNPTENPLAAMPKLDIALDAPGSALNMEAPSIGIALTGREKGAKDALLSAYGGGAATESAVGNALEWLRKNQQRDGSWSLSGPYSNAVPVENRTGATAMALLAFQGNGHTHLQGAHRETVSKGIKALLKMQDSDGNFFQSGSSNHRLYSQAMATIVVCESYGMTKDAEMKKSAEKALDYAAKIQADDGQGGGGWRYHPRQDVDTSVTGWFVMAFQSARMAGLEPPQEVLPKVAKFLDRVEKVEFDFDQSVKDIGYYYRPDESNEPPRLSMTAEALLCRQYMGWDRNEPKLRAGVNKMLKKENVISWSEPNFYYWYYATQVMHHMGGDEWHQWNTVMREVLPMAQEKAGKEKGSWSPAGDYYGAQGGRLYSTCFCVFMLESYYRHLPIYRQRP